MNGMLIEGNWYPQGSADFRPAKLKLTADSFQLLIEDQIKQQGTIDSLLISDRIGNIERRITFADGSVFASSDNRAVDQIKSSGIKGFIHRLEASMGWVVLALFITITAVFGFAKWGLPWSSHQIAHALPDDVNQAISVGALDFLDEHMLSPSELDQDRQQQISSHFLELASLVDKEKLSLKLHFRSWTMGEKQIPNALALPSGDIIVTDRFIELCQSQGEMDSVLLHEIGHVSHRHGLESLIKATFITVIAMSVFGDNSGLADMGVGLGSLLLTSSYSRQHESEADVYAFEKMLEAGIDPANFSSIMRRMTADLRDGKVAENQTESDEFMDYFASHPNTQERIDLANKYSECYRQQKSFCD